MARDEGGGDALAAFAAAEALRSAADEQSRLEAMGLLIYSCAGREVDRDSQTTAAKAGVVPLLAPLVGSGSTHQRMMAANTLLILCFKHADNAALVGQSPAVEAASSSARSATGDSARGGSRPRLRSCSSWRGVSRPRRRLATRRSSCRPCGLSC